MCGREANKVGAGAVAVLPIFFGLGALSLITQTYLIRELLVVVHGTELAMGLLFQIPVAILIATRAEIVTARQLRRNRRYAILACAAVAALLPGDAITMAFETVPLYLLFEISLVLASIAERRRRRAAAHAVR